MRLSDIKGIYAQNLIAASNKLFVDLFMQLFKDEFDCNIKLKNPPTISTVTMLKCLFNKDGITTDFGVPIAFISYPKNHMYQAFAEVININLFKELGLFDTKPMDPDKTYIKTYHGTFEYVDYFVKLSFMYVPIRQSYTCMIDYKFVGNLNMSLNYCPVPNKRTSFNFQDMFGNTISENDEILYIKASRHNGCRGHLAHSFVSKFDEGFIITIDNKRISAHEGYKNDHIAIVNGKIKFAGMVIN